MSFEPVHYFANADLDEQKWEELQRRLRPRKTEIRAVLDIGCGTGAFLKFMGKRIPGVARVGIEVDPTRAAQARARNPDARISL